MTHFISRDQGDGAMLRKADDLFLKSKADTMYKARVEGTHELFQACASVEALNDTSVLRGLE